MKGESPSVQKTKAIYNQSAAKWQRREPNLLTDFSARALIFDLCTEIQHKKIIDLGCGEGYVSRYCATHGADEVTGIDISSSMIEQAQLQEQQQPLGIHYQCASITEIEFGTNKFDLALAVFVFNYLTIAEMEAVFNKVFACLKNNGEFIFALPHPLLPFIMDKQAPTYFENGDYGYYSGRDKIFPGKVWCVDGTVLEVQMLHKTFADIFASLANAGFTQLPETYELSVPEELLLKAPDIFQTGADKPLHIVFRLKK